jgi:hypothetical protein
VQMLELETWYAVYCNEKGFGRIVSPPESEGWKDFVAWDRIIRVCFQTAEYFLCTDEIIVFTKDREEGYVIPTEALGGPWLWGEIIERGLFDAELGIKVASADEGECYCWPPE